MPLPTDEASVTKVVGLKHYSELCAAARVEAQPDKIALVKAFRTKFNAASLPVSEEKEWVALLTEAIRLTKKSSSDAFDWLWSFRQKQAGLNLQRFSQILKTLGAAAPELINAFGPAANLERLKVVATTFGPGVTSWLAVLPANPTIDGVLAWASQLTGADMATKDVHNFWTRLDGVDRPSLWPHIDSAPELVRKAWQHAGKLQNLGDFWMKKMDAAKQQGRLGRLMEIVYHQKVWSDKPDDVNTLALALTKQADIPWLKVFDIGQLIAIREALRHKADFNKIFFQTAGRLANLNQDPTKDSALGIWLCHSCHYVAHLTHHGITINAIMAMFQHELEPREMITCTWFQQQPALAGQDDLLFFKVANVNGGLIGRRSHLATRHLYQHFNFAETKDKNSFHPRGTTISQMVEAANSLTLANRSSGTQTIGPYSIFIGEHANPEKRLVVSLYPAMPDTHRDYYTRAQLERIRKVLPSLGARQPLDFPT